MAVDTTTYLADMKIVYGDVQNQISVEPAFINALGKFTGEKVDSLGARGYVFLARLAPNWNLGFRLESSSVGVGTAGNQGLANSTVLLKYGYAPITITGQAENLSKGKERAFMQAKALEAKWLMKDFISHLNVIMVGCLRGGELGRVLSVAGQAITMSTAGNLPGARYLRAGMFIDSVPNGGAAASFTNVKINSINYATNVVTVASGTAVAGDALALTGEYALTTGTFPYTPECLTSLIDNANVTIQGLNPTTAGQESWQSQVFDNGNAALTSPIIHQLRQFVKNRSGQDVDIFLFPSEQINQLVTIATSTMQFRTDQARTDGQKKALDIGYTAFEYAGLMIVEEKDCRADRIYGIDSSSFKKFEAVPLSMAEDEAGTWTRILATTGIVDAVAALLRNYIQLGTVCRSGAGVFKNLAVPANFVNVPPTV